MANPWDTSHFLQWRSLRDFVQPFAVFLRSEPVVKICRSLSSCRQNRSLPPAFRVSFKRRMMRSIAADGLSGRYRTRTGLGTDISMKDRSVIFVDDRVYSKGEAPTAADKQIGNAAQKITATAKGFLTPYAPLPYLCSPLELSKDAPNCLLYAAS